MRDIKQQYFITGAINKINSIIITVGNSYCLSGIFFIKTLTKYFGNFWSLKIGTRCFQKV